MRLSAKASWIRCWPRQCTQREGSHDQDNAHRRDIADCRARFGSDHPASPTVEEQRAPRTPRARGIPTALAVEADQAAIATCAAQGLKVTALTIDSEGVPIALISGDGAATVTQRIASGKAEVALKMKMTSGEAVERAKTDQAFMAQLMGDPAMGMPRKGGVPIIAGGEVIGAIAVSGAPSGDQDEPCAKAGLAKIQDRLH